jgi:uncharacterized protein YcbX
MSLAIDSLHVYPVKGLRGFSVPSLPLDRFGARGDRRFLVVDPDGRFITQRTHPRMATVNARYDATDALVLSDDLGSALRVPTPEPGAPARPMPATIWEDSVELEDCGDDAACFLSDLLQAPCRLGRMGTAYRRPIRRAPEPLPGYEVVLADGFPLLVTTDGSLDDLNRRLEERGAPAVPMDRFRPNVVVRGASAFDEDRWEEIAVGETRLRLVKPCARCPVVTTDQRSGERSKEPLATLALFRRDPDRPTLVNFGQNAVSLDFSGILRAGEAVTVTRLRATGSG